MVISATVTAFMCGCWFLKLKMSHLSFGNNVDSRICRRRKRRSAMKLQRQLMAAFLCGLANAKAMEEQPGLQEAFLQRMTYAEAATRAAAAAEKALERTTAGGSKRRTFSSFESSKPQTYSQGKMQCCFSSGNINLQAGYVSVTTGIPKLLTTLNERLKLLH